MLRSCNNLPATPENARLAIEKIALTFPPPKHSSDFIQTVMCCKRDCEGNPTLWDFANFYEANIKDDPVLDPASGKFVLEYIEERWRIMSEEDFKYFFG